MTKFLSRCLKAVILTVLLMSGGCSSYYKNAQSIDYSGHYKTYLEHYKYNDQYAGFISERISFDMYVSSWFSQISKITSFELEKEEALKYFLLNYEFQELSNTEHHPYLINLLSYVRLSTEFEVDMNEDIKSKIIDLFISNQNIENGLFVSQDSSLRDTFTTVIAIEVLSLLETDIPYKNKIISSIETIDPLDQAKIYDLLGVEIPTYLETQLKDLVKDINVIDSYEKLYYFYALKRFLSYELPADIVIKLDDTREPRVLYELLYLLAPNIPSELKNSVNSMLYNRSADIGWGDSADFSVLQTYLGLIMLDSFDDELTIDLDKIIRYFKSYVNNLYVKRVTQKENLNVFEMRELIFILKSPINTDEIKREVSKIIETQVLETESLQEQEFELILELLYLSNNDKLLQHINLTTLNSNDINRIADLYTYVLRIYPDAKKEKKQVLSQLDTFNTDDEFFFADSPGSSGSLEGLIYAVKITNLLDSEIKNKDKIILKLAELIKNETDFTRLGVLIELQNDLIKKSKL